MGKEGVVCVSVVWSLSPILIKFFHSGMTQRLWLWLWLWLWPWLCSAGTWNIQSFVESPSRSFPPWTNSLLLQVLCKIAFFSSCFASTDVCISTTQKFFAGGI